MRLLTSIAAAAAMVAPLVATDAPAQIVAASRAYKTVAPGGSVVVTWFLSLNPDCSSRGRYTINLLSDPRGGQVLVDRSAQFPTFAKTNDRSACNHRRFPADEILYRAHRDFTGIDTFDVEVVDPDQTARKFRYAVNVE